MSSLIGSIGNRRNNALTFFSIFFLDFAHHRHSLHTSTFISWQSWNDSPLMTFSDGDEPLEKLWRGGGGVGGKEQKKYSCKAKSYLWLTAKPRQNSSFLIKGGGAWHYFSRFSFTERVYFSTSPLMKRNWELCFVNYQSNLRCYSAKQDGYRDQTVRRSNRFNDVNIHAQLY